MTTHLKFGVKDQKNEILHAIVEDRIVEDLLACTSQFDEGPNEWKLRRGLKTAFDKIVDCNKIVEDCNKIDNFDKIVEDLYQLQQSRTRTQREKICRMINDKRLVHEFLIFINFAVADHTECSSDGKQVVTAAAVPHKVQQTDWR